MSENSHRTEDPNSTEHLVPEYERTLQRLRTEEIDKLLRAGIPQEPKRETAGRYGEQLWSYKGELTDFQRAGRLYEYDRAEYYKALSERQQYELEMMKRRDL